MQESEEPGQKKLIENHIKMKTKSLAIVCILILGFVTSCDHETIRASDVIQSLSYTFPNYSTLKVSSAFNAYVTFSDTEESIRIEANENLHDKIIVKKEGSKLIIRLKQFTSIRGNATLNAYIVTKDISKFEINGASNVALENEWDTQNAKIEVSGASDFSGEIRSDRMDIEMSGASSTAIYGSIDTMYTDLSGSSDLSDYDLSVNKLNIELSGASEAFLTVNESIVIEASGASVMNYRGNAIITRKELSGASELRNRN